MSADTIAQVLALMATLTLKVPAFPDPDRCPPCRRAFEPQEVAVRTCIDLNNDGASDLLQGWPSATWGNSGGEFTIFLQKPDGSYREVGRLLLHTKAANFSAGEHRQGFLSVYHHLSAAEGYLRRYEVSFSGVTLVSERKLLFGDENEETRSEYERLFGDDVRLELESGRCVANPEAGELQWQRIGRDGAP